MQVTLPLGNMKFPWGPPYLASLHQFACVPVCRGWAVVEQGVSLHNVEDLCNTFAFRWLLSVCRLFGLILLMLLLLYYYLLYYYSPSILICHVCSVEAGYVWWSFHPIDGIIDSFSFPFTFTSLALPNLYSTLLFPLVVCVCARMCVCVCVCVCVSAGLGVMHVTSIPNHKDDLQCKSFIYLE